MPAYPAESETVAAPRTGRGEGERGGAFRAIAPAPRRRSSPLKILSTHRPVTSYLMTGLKKNSLVGVPWVCIAQDMWFSDFAKFLKGCKFALSYCLPRARKLSASGGFAPPPDPHQGVCAWTPLGALPPDLRIGSRSPCLQASALP